MKENRFRKFVVNSIICEMLKGCNSMGFVLFYRKHNKSEYINHSINFDSYLQKTWNFFSSCCFVLCTKIVLLPNLSSSLCVFLWRTHTYTARLFVRVFVFHSFLFCSFCWPFLLLLHKWNLWGVSLVLVMFTEAIYMLIHKHTSRTNDSRTIVSVPLAIQ